MSIKTTFIASMSRKENTVFFHSLPWGLVFFVGYVIIQAHKTRRIHNSKSNIETIRYGQYTMFSYVL